MMEGRYGEERVGDNFRTGREEKRGLERGKKIRGREG